MTRHSNALANYLESDRVVVPRDYQDFQQGGAQSDFCLFCSSPLEDYQNVLYVRNPVSKKLDMLHCCACDSCDETISQHLGVNFAGISLNATTQSRIEEFVRFGTFDDDHIHYRVGYRNANIRDAHCYFCQNRIQGDFVTTLSPVTESKIRTGGLLYTCKGCRNEIDKRAGTVYDNEYIYSKCDACKKTYAYTHKEDEYRGKLPGNTKYNCPSCVEKSIFLREQDPKSILADRYRRLPEDRYSTALNCASCGTGPLLFDLYLDYTLLHRVCVDATQHKCKKCAEGFEKLAEEVSSKQLDIFGSGEIVIETDSHQIILKKEQTTKLWGFEIVRSSGVTYLERFFAYGSVDDAVENALEVIVRDINTTYDRNKTKG